MNVGGNVNDLVVVVDTKAIEDTNFFDEGNRLQEIIDRAVN